MKRVKVKGFGEKCAAYTAAHFSPQGRYFGITKEKIDHWTIIRPIVMCGSEAWSLSRSDTHSLSLLEVKMLRNIFGPVKESGVRSVRTNQEFVDLYTEPDTYCLRNQKNEIMGVRTRGKNARRKNCVENV
jgi:hypothetical protein